MPARSLNTYIFMIDQGSTAIEEQERGHDGSTAYYDLHGRLLEDSEGALH